MIGNRKVILVFRKPIGSSFSIEYLFKTLLQSFRSKGLAASAFTLPHHSQGMISRLTNIFSLFKFRGGIVHITGDVYYAILGALFSKRVITIHDLSFMFQYSGINKTILKWFWIILPVKFSHKVIIISNATKSHLLEYVKIPSSKIEIIYDFIDESYKPVERIFNIEAPRILQIGTFFNKNIERVIEAVSSIRCTLVVVGKLTANYENLLTKSEVHYENKFNLSNDELRLEYEKADFLTFVSTIEGFGMPILEAQATGLPVITSNCSSMPEIAGDGAFFADPLDVSSIKNQITILLNDQSEREEKVRRGFENVKRFSKEKVTQDYVAVYKSLN